MPANDISKQFSAAVSEVLPVKHRENKVCASKGQNPREFLAQGFRFPFSFLFLPFLFSCLCNPAVLVTAHAFMEGRFVEVDSVHVTKELFVLPRGQKVVEHQLDYFCTSAGNQQKGI